MPSNSVLLNKKKMVGYTMAYAIYSESNDRALVWAICQFKDLI